MVDIFPVQRPCLGVEVGVRGTWALASGSMYFTWELPQLAGDHGMHERLPFTMVPLLPSKYAPMEVIYF